MVGQAIRVRRLISPKAFMPISTTAASWVPSSSRRVRGMPMRLFRFSRFFRTRKAGARIAAIISLVVVLPQLPVMPTTGTGKRARQAWARSPRAVRASRYGDDGYSPAGTVGAGLKPAPTGCPQYSLFHQHPPGAPEQGLGDEFVAVVALPGEGDEELPGLAGAGVGADAAEGVPGALVHQGAAGGGQNFGDGEGGAYQSMFLVPSPDGEGRVGVNPSPAPPTRGGERFLIRVIITTIFNRSSPSGCATSSRSSKWRRSAPQI